MAGSPSRERADAARNRAAILRAVERLLAERGAEHVSLDTVAAVAGVGKGTVFRRFGSRTGLLTALLHERMAALRTGIVSGPPPLGPGAPPVERLAAFFDAIVDVATRNLPLVAAYQHSVSGPQRAQSVNEIYDAWHAHVAALIGRARPDLDADLLAHVLLGALHAEPVRRLLAAGDADRVAATMRALVDSVFSGR